MEALASRICYLCLWKLLLSISRKRWEKLLFSRKAVLGTHMYVQEAEDTVHFHTLVSFEIKQFDVYDEPK